MPKNFNGKTYYDVLKVYFERQFVEPLTANEQALMTHIMHLCNFARNAEITTTLARLSMVSNLSRSSIGHALDNLSAKGYITASALPNKCTRIVLQLSNDCPISNENVQAESDFSGSKKREEQIRKEREEENLNLNSEMGGRTLFNRRLPPRPEKKPKPEKKYQPEKKPQPEKTQSVSDILGDIADELSESRGWIKED